MILIFGGAYQGKLEYAREKFEIDRVSDCYEGGDPDFSAEAICGIEAFVTDCVKRGVEAKDFFVDTADKWQDKILIITDTSQGVVPIDRDVRAAREMNGRLMLYLSGEAERVIRVFCGIGKDIK